MLESDFRKSPAILIVFSPHCWCRSFGLKQCCQMYIGCRLQNCGQSWKSAVCWLLEPKSVLRQRLLDDMECEDLGTTLHQSQRLPRAVCSGKTGGRGISPLRKNRIFRSTGHVLALHSRSGQTILDKKKWYDHGRRCGWTILDKRSGTTMDGLVVPCVRK